MKWPVFQHEAMATYFEITLAGPDLALARYAAAAAFRELDRLEAVLSRFVETSDISRANGLAPSGPSRPQHGGGQRARGDDDAHGARLRARGGEARLALRCGTATARAAPPAKVATPLPLPLRSPPDRAWATCQWWPARRAR